MGSRNPNRLPIVGLLSLSPVGSCSLAKCRSCGRESPLPTPTILERHEPLVPLHAVWRPLRCSGWGGAGADIYLAELPDP